MTEPSQPVDDPVSKVGYALATYMHQMLERLRADSFEARQKAKGNPLELLALPNDEDLVGLAVAGCAGAMVMDLVKILDKRFPGVQQEFVAAVYKGLTASESETPTP